MSQADSVLLTAKFDSAPALGEVEKQCVWNGEDGCVRALVNVQDKADVANNPQGQAADYVKPQALPHLTGNLILDVRRELVLLHPGICAPGFSTVIYTATLYSKYTRALTF